MNVSHFLPWRSWLYTGKIIQPDPDFKVFRVKVFCVIIHEAIWMNNLFVVFPSYFQKLPSGNHLKQFAFDFNVKL